MAPERDNLVVVRLPSRRDFKESTVLDRCMCVHLTLLAAGKRISLVTLQSLETSAYLSLPADDEGKRRKGMALRSFSPLHSVSPLRSLFPHSCQHSD